MSFEDSLQIIANMYDKEKAEFTQTANYLLSSTYILREDNKNRISKHICLSTGILNCFTKFSALLAGRYTETRNMALFIHIMNQHQTN